MFNFIRTHFWPKEIPEGMDRPPKYGKTWVLYRPCMILFHPIPLNVILRFCIHIQIWCGYGGFKSKYEHEKLSAYLHGYTDGQRDFIKKLGDTKWFVK